MTPDCKSGTLETTGVRLPLFPPCCIGGVAELADAPDLGSGATVRVGSTPITPTIYFLYIKKSNESSTYFYLKEGEDMSKYFVCSDIHGYYTEWMKALKDAQCLDIIKQKQNGLEEMIEQGGRNLSGGQRQRLSIARALVKKPEILILDDSSSALDYLTDYSLRTAVKNLDYNPTVIMVSQRTSSIEHADKILVLDDGKIVGFDTHYNLLNNCTVYKEIYDSQFKGGSHE